jgi:hypothetical protein
MSELKSSLYSYNNGRVHPEIIQINKLWLNNRIFYSSIQTSGGVMCSVFWETLRRKRLCWTHWSSGTRWVFPKRIAKTRFACLRVAVSLRDSTRMFAGIAQ